MRFSTTACQRWGISIMVAFRGSLGVLAQQNDCVAFASSERTVDQITLRRNDCDRLVVQGVGDQESIIGHGGYMTLVNGSPFDWVNSGSTHAYQMSAWSWPTISAGKSVKVYVEFGSKGAITDDAGEAYYNVAGTTDKFSVLARVPTLPNYKLTISLDDMSTNQSQKNPKIDLGFRHDAAVNWIMSMDEAGQWWSNSGTYTDWMQQSMGSLANRTLKHICMPGSHDAGMSTFTRGSGGASYINTQAQYLDFYQQLMAGSRYFDLRPVLSGGQWVSGHYTVLRTDLGAIGLGGNGQSLADIIRQVNDFTSKYKELVIINLSHTLDTDNKYQDLSQDQWNKLFDTLKGINNRFTVTNPGITDFSNKVLGDFISNGPSVFIVSRLPNGIALGNYANQGFYSDVHFPLSDYYSDTNDRATMEADQFRKLRDARNVVADAATRHDTFHVLSWTLTQQTEDLLNYDKAILNMGAAAFDDLASEAWNQFTPQSFPNVLYVDALGIRDKSVMFMRPAPVTVPVNNDIAALAVAVNNRIAGRNGYVTGR